MPRVSAFSKVKGLIQVHFNTSKQKVFTLQDLEPILAVNGPLWKLPASTTVDLFAEQLIAAKVLSANSFRFRTSIPERLRFWTIKADLYDVVLSLLPRAYLSHATALSLHGIQTEHPERVFVSTEQSVKERSSATASLLQEDVDNAFMKTQRISNAICEFNGYEIVALNGMFTNRAGVINLQGKAVTNIERTLIDIAVRPAYAGGAAQVAKTYVMLRDKVSVADLITLLDEINYIYPYFQSVGFYLELAGYDVAAVQVLKEREKYIDFYLEHAMEEPAYSQEWQLYYPAALTTQS